MIKVKDLIKQLEKLEQDQYIKVACDEEWNTIFNDFEIGKHGVYVVFGLSGSEEESWEDVANDEFDKQID